MKKQAFILFVAIFALGISNAFAQAVPGTAPRPLTCDLNDPMAPVAGRPYTYQATMAPANGTTFWYATKSTTFMNNGTRVATPINADGTSIATGATNYMTSASNASSPSSTTVTWTSSGLSGVTAVNPLFMVMEYAGSCSNNMKVMKIVPKVAFTVDIANMAHGATPSPLGYDATESQCYADVASSSWDAANNNITIDYGVNTLYFEVVAANFTGSYSPTFKLTGLSGTQTADIDWGVTVGSYPNSLATGLTGASVTTSPTTVNTSVASTANGVSIYVRVTIHNHGWEGLANNNISLAVEAVDSASNSDVDATCATGAGFEDIAMQTLNARPTVTGDPATPFLPQKN